MAGAEYAMCTVHWPCAEDKQTWQYMMNRTDEQKRLLTVMECATDNTVGARDLGYGGQVLR